MKNTLLIGALSALAVAGCREVVPPAVPSFTVDFATTNSLVTANNYRGRTPSKIIRTAKGASLEFTGVRNAKPGEQWSEDTLWGLTTVPFAVTPKDEYCLCLRFSGDVPIGYHRFVSEMRWFKADGKPLMTVDQLGKDRELVDAVRLASRVSDNVCDAVAHTVGQVPPEAARAQLVITVDDPNLKPGEKISVHEISYFEHRRGERWMFDDIDAPTLELPRGTALKDANEPLRFRINDASGVDWKTVTCKIDGKAVALSELKRAGDDFLFAPATPWKPDSLHSVEIVASDVNGMTGYDCVYASFAAKPVSHRACALRDDGTMLLDGQPFFPLGIFSVHPNPGNGFDVEKDVREMVANGLNVAHTYMVRGRYGQKKDAEYDSLVKACDKHGMLLYSEPSVRRLPTEEHVRKISENVFRGRSYGALFGWGIGDDTSVNTSPEGLKRLHRVCKAVDPGALTVSADVIQRPSHQAQYIPYADVLLLEVYPIRQPQPEPGEMAKVALAVDNAWEAVDISKAKGTSVMALPQCFKGWSSWKRYPTKEEVRAQSFIALCCRARGILYYTSYSYKANEGPFNNPQHLKEFFEVTREIAALKPSLVKRDAARQPTIAVTKGASKNALGGPAVRTLLKEDGLLLVANTSQKPVTVEITLPNGRKIVRDLTSYGAFAEKVQ